MKEGEEEMSDINNLKIKKLLTVKEYALYLGIGETKARQLLRDSKLGYRVRLGDTIMDLYLDNIYIDC